MLRALPTGTVTFVFTDIAGSTKLLDEFGEKITKAKMPEEAEKVVSGIGSAGRTTPMTTSPYIWMKRR